MGEGFVASDDDRIVVGPGRCGCHSGRGAALARATDSSPLVQRSPGIPGTSDFHGETFTSTE
jgi:hypothetical protein